MLERQLRCYRPESCETKPRDQARLYREAIRGPVYGPVSDTGSIDRYQDGGAADYLAVRRVRRDKPYARGGPAAGSAVSTRSKSPIARRTAHTFLDPVQYPQGLDRTDPSLIRIHVLYVSVSTPGCFGSPGHPAPPPPLRPHRWLCTSVRSRYTES